MKLVQFTDRELKILIKILKHTIPDQDDQEVAMTLSHRLERALRLSETELD